MELTLPINHHSQLGSLPLHPSKKQTDGTSGKGSPSLKPEAVPVILKSIVFIIFILELRHPIPHPTCPPYQQQRNRSPEVGSLSSVPEPVKVIPLVVVIVVRLRVRIDFYAAGETEAAELGVPLAR